MAVPNLTADTSASTLIASNADIWAKAIEGMAKSYADSITAVEKAKEEKKDRLFSDKLNEEEYNEKIQQKNSLPLLKKALATSLYNGLLKNIDRQTGSNLKGTHGIELKDEPDEENVSRTAPALEPIKKEVEKTTEPTRTLEPVSENASPIDVTAEDQMAPGITPADKISRSDALTEDVSVFDVDNTASTKQLDPSTTDNSTVESINKPAEVPQKVPENMLANQEDLYKKKGINKEEFIAKTLEEIETLGLGHKELKEAMDNLTTAHSLEDEAYSIWGKNSFPFLQLGVKDLYGKGQAVLSQQKKYEAWQVEHAREYVQTLFNQYEKENTKSPDFKTVEDFKSWAEKNHAVKNDTGITDEERGISKYTTFLMFDKKNTFMQEILNAKYDDKSTAYKKQQDSMAQKAAAQKTQEEKDKSLGDDSYKAIKGIDGQILSLRGQVSANLKHLSSKDFMDLVMSKVGDVSYKAREGIEANDKANLNRIKALVHEQEFIRGGLEPLTAEKLANKLNTKPESISLTDQALILSIIPGQSFEPLPGTGNGKNKSAIIPPPNPSANTLGADPFVVPPASQFRKIPKVTNE